MKTKAALTYEIDFQQERTDRENMSTRVHEIEEQYKKKLNLAQTELLHLMMADTARRSLSAPRERCTVLLSRREEGTGSSSAKPSMLPYRFSHAGSHSTISSPPLSPHPPSSPPPPYSSLHHARVGAFSAPGPVTQSHSSSNQGSDHGGGEEPAAVGVAGEEGLEPTLRILRTNLECMKLEWEHVEQERDHEVEKNKSLVVKIEAARSRVKDLISLLDEKYSAQIQQMEDKMREMEEAHRGELERVKRDAAASAKQHNRDHVDKMKTIISKQGQPEMAESLKREYDRFEREASRTREELERREESHRKEVERLEREMEQHLQQQLSEAEFSKEQIRQEMTRKHTEEMEQLKQELNRHFSSEKDEQTVHKKRRGRWWRGN